jgi:hypothetical protein
MMEAPAKLRLIGCTLVLALLGMLCAGRSSMAQSEGGWVATVHGSGREPVLPGSALAIAAGDFTDVNTRLQTVIEQALIAQGFGVDANASLQLVYSTQLSNATDGPTSGEPPTGSEVGDMQEDRQMDAEGPDTGPHPSQFEQTVPQVNVSLGEAGKSSLSRYTLDFVLGAPGQTPVWTGGVAVALPSQDPFPVAQGMVRILVPQIGKTVNAAQAFPQ